MADFFKGLTGGFQSGLQLGEAMRAKQEREALREAMGLTPQEMQQRQATPAEFGRAQAETQGIAAQDAAMFGLTPQDQGMYAPQMPVEGQRIGATQYGLGGQTFNRMPTQQEIESARYAAAANVIAERDPVAAMRMRQEQTRMQREAEEAPLRRRALEAQVGVSESQLTESQRTSAERDEAKSREKANATAWQNRLSVKDADGNVTGVRPPNTEDMLWAAQQSAQSLYGAGKTTEAMGAYKDYMVTAKGQIELQSAERGEALKSVVARVNQGDFSAAKDFYHKYVPDGTNVKSFEQGKDGVLTIKRVDLQGNALPDFKVTKDQLVQQLVAFDKPEELIKYTQQSFMNGIHERQITETERHNRRTEGLQSEQLAQTKISPIEKNVEGLRRLGVNVTPAMVETLGGLDKADSPRLKAQLDVITSAVKEGTLKPEEGLKRVDTVFTEFNKSKQAARDQTEIVSGIKDEAKKGNLPQLVTYLKSELGYTDAALAPLFAEAGVKMPASTAAPAPAVATQRTPLVVNPLSFGAGGFGLSR